jgi:hypothetical protein
VARVSRNEHWPTLPSVGNQVNTAFKARSRDAEPKVRIRLPPAKSPVQRRSEDAVVRQPASASADEARVTVAKLRAVTPAVVPSNVIKQKIGHMRSLPSAAFGLPHTVWRRGVLRLST